MFNNTFRIGFTTKTGLEAIKDLESQNTIIDSDDGKDIVVSLSSDTDQSGFISILTDNQLLIKRISKFAQIPDEEGVLTEGYVNLNLPDIYDFTKIYNGGKVFYLYQDTTLALAMTASTTSQYKIRYKSYELVRKYPHVSVGEGNHYSENPFKLKVNTIYEYSQEALNVVSALSRTFNVIDRKAFIKEGIRKDALHHVLPENAQIGDYIEFGYIYSDYHVGHVCYQIKSEAKINGSDEDFINHSKIVACTFGDDGWIVIEKRKKR